MDMDELHKLLKKYPLRKKGSVSSLPKNLWGDNLKNLPMQGKTLKEMAEKLDKVFNGKSAPAWENDKAKIENNFLRDENYKLGREVTNLKSANTKLKNKYKQLEKQLEELEKRVEEMNNFGREDILDLEE